MYCVVTGALYIDGGRGCPAGCSEDTQRDSEADRFCMIHHMQVSEVISSPGIVYDIGRRAAIGG